MATNAELALKKSTVKYYTSSSADTSSCFRARSFAVWAEFRSNRSVDLRQKGHAVATIRGVRATLSTVLQAAVERGYLEKNVAHGIRIRETAAKIERRFYTPAQVGNSSPVDGTLSHSRPTCSAHRNADRRNTRPPVETCRPASRHDRSRRDVFGWRLRLSENPKQ